MHTLEEINTAYFLDAPDAAQAFSAHVREHLKRARSCHPDISLSEGALARAIAEKLSDAVDAERDPDAWMQNLLAEDFYLARAVLARDPAAWTAFEHAYNGQLEGLARRYANETMSADDMVQVLRAKLFVGNEERLPKLDEFAGQGALRSWLQITAVRSYIDATRSHNRRTASEALVEGDFFDHLVHESQDLELDFLKRQYKDAFKVAFASGVEALTPRERSLLSQSLVSGLSIDQIGAMYDVHRATAARWITRARGSLITHTRAAMMRQLEIDAGELDSIMGLIESRASVSLSRLFRPTQDPS